MKTTRMPKADKSFCHEIFPTIDGEARYFCPVKGNGRGERWACCACKGPPAIYWTYYEYVTGRRGRVSARRQAVCPGCAAKFAARYGVAVPAAEAPTA